MRKQVPMVEHEKPDVAIGNKTCRMRRSDHFPRRRHRECHTALLEEILECFPGELEREFETVDETFLFQRIKRCRTTLNAFLEEGERAGEVGVSLLPSDVGCGLHCVCSKVSGTSKSLRRQNTTE